MVAAHLMEVHPTAVESRLTVAHLHTQNLLTRHHPTNKSPPTQPHPIQLHRTITSHHTPRHPIRRHLITRNRLTPLHLTNMNLPIPLLHTQLHLMAAMSLLTVVKNPLMVTDRLIETIYLESFIP